MEKKWNKTIFLLLILFLCMVSVPGCSSSTAPQVIQLDGFQITLTELDIDFPDSITFNIQVNSNTSISRITFQYQIDMMSSLPVTGVAFPDFESSTSVKTSWTMDMIKSGGLPPGAEIEYWWSIEDSQGNTVETTSKEVIFKDKEHSWSSLVNSQTTIYWYDGNMSFASSLMSATQQAIVKLSEDTGAAFNGDVRIYVYADSEALREALIYPQEWTGGVAFPEFGTIALGISPENLPWGMAAIAHEISHLVLHNFIFNSYGVEMPTWLDEGLAMYAQGELSSGYRSRLNNAIEDNELFTVKSLSSSFPTQGDEARLAYAQSYSLVEYLLSKQGGQANILKLLEAFKQGNGYTDALDTVYGLDIEQLNTIWREYIGAND